MMGWSLWNNTIASPQTDARLLSYALVIAISAFILLYIHDSSVYVPHTTYTNITDTYLRNNTIVDVTNTTCEHTKSLIDFLYQTAKKVSELAIQCSSKKFP